MSARSAARLFWIALALYLAWGALYIHRTSFVYEGERVFCLWDDAMISMQYARNLREGHGLVWNAGGERVQGITNPGVTLVMAALHLLPLPPEQVSLAFQLLNLALLAVALRLVWVVARRLHPGDPGIAAGAALAAAACAPLGLWSLQGSDVGCVSVWLLGAAAILSGPAGGERRWPPWLPGYLALGLLIRPDTLIFSAVLLAGSLAFPGRRARRLAAGGAVLAAAVGAIALASWLYYGDPLPNTWYLKATGSPRRLMLWSGFAQVASWGPQLAVPLLLAGAALRRPPRALVARLAVALFGAALLYNVWVGGDWSFTYGSRFVVPCLPLLFVPAVAGCRSLLRRAPLPAFLAAAALVGVAVSPVYALLEWFAPGTPPLHHRYNEENYRYALYLRDHTAPSTSLAVHWAGVPPYFSRRPAIDVLGKSDRHIAKLEVPHFVPGHSKWDWDYVLERRRPDVLRGPSRGLGKRSDFQRSYYRVVPATTPGFYLRKESLAKLTDPGALLVDPVTGARFLRGRGPSPVSLPRRLREGALRGVELPAGEGVLGP